MGCLSAKHEKQARSARRSFPPLAYLVLHAHASQNPLEHPKKRLLCRRSQMVLSVSIKQNMRLKKTEFLILRLTTILIFRLEKGKKKNGIVNFALDNHSYFPLRKRQAHSHTGLFYQDKVQLKELDHEFKCADSLRPRASA